MKKAIAGTLMVVASLTSALPALAGGLATSGQGARAIGMGGAFTAVADDGSCIYYNPAGLSQIDGTRIEAGVALILPEIKYEMANGSVHESTKNAWAPSLFVTHHFNDKFGAGLGFYAPYARESDFGSDPANGFLAQRAKMVRTDLSPVVSYKVTEQISAGLGLVASYGVIDQSIPAGPAMRISDKSDGFGFGGIAGLLWKLNEYVKLGGTYRTRMTVNQSGDRTIEQGGSATTSDAKSDVHYPSSLGLGIAVMPTKKLTIALDGDWYEWSYMKAVTTRTDLWPDSTAEINAHNSWDIRIGGEYILPYDIAVRAGYGFIQAAVPDTNILPSKPDADGHEIDIGIGKKLGNFQIDLNYEYLFTAEVSPDANIYQFNGKYNIAQHIAGMTVSYIF